MSTNKPKILTQENIVQSLYPQVLTQKIYKAKVIFMGVLRDDPNYNQVRSFSANGRRYSVVDGGISYLPAEALAALQDAVPVYTVHANEKQKKDGIDHEDPSDKFKKMKNPRYDITILEEFKIGKDEAGKNILISVTETGKKAELDRAEKAAYAAIKAEIEQTVREEMEEKIRAEIAAETGSVMDDLEEDMEDVKLVEVSDEDFENLLNKDKDGE